MAREVAREVARAVARGSLFIYHLKRPLCCRTVYYTYNLETALYMFEPWEKMLISELLVC